MKRIILAVGVLALALAAPVAAHNTPWGWSAQAAANEVADSTLEWEDTDTGETIYDVVMEATCIGQGPSFRRTARGPKLYKHFRCLVDAVDQHGTEDRYWIRFHVLGRYRWDYDFLSRP
jgi:hypothetical protein